MQRGPEFVIGSFGIHSSFVIRHSSFLLRRLAVPFLALLVVLLPGAALGAGTAGGSLNVEIPGYDAKTGDLIWKLEAAKVDPAPGKPKVFLVTDVRLTVYQHGKSHLLTGQKGTADTERNAGTLQGNVTVVFGDEQSTRVETDEAAWDYGKGVATGQGPVKVVSKGLTAEGVGFRIVLREFQTGQKKVRADEVTLLQKVRVVIRPATSRSLLSPPAVPSPREKPGPPKAAQAAEPQASKAVEPKAREPEKAGEAPAPKAETSLKGPSAPKESAEPIVITCAGPLTVYRAATTAVFRDDVLAVQAAQSLKCDTLTITLAPAKDGKKESESRFVVNSLTAVGNVRLDDGRSLSRADLVVWNRKEGSAKPEEGAAKLTGQPAEVVWENGNRMAAGLIERFPDGAELACSATDDYPKSAYLFGRVAQSGPPAPQKNHERTDKSAPRH